MTYPDGQVVRHHYNSEGQLTAVEGVASNLTWSAAGQLLSIRYANGTQSQFDYDNSGGG